MKKLKLFFKRFMIFLVLLGAFMFLNNTNLFSKTEPEAPKLLAHRGLAQTFTMEGITSDTCTAQRIYEPEHPNLENTISSMEAAFEAGADLVELDVQPTTDGEFAVFHDWTLECRTDGEGVTREHSMDDLKKLDIGYGYTSDNGKTYPFRGKGVGLMPTLEEVLTHFPDRSLLIHIKSDDPKEGELLAQYISEHDDGLDNLSVYGGDQPVAALKEKLPNTRVMSMETLKSCLIPYLAVGWTGYIPSTCENTQLHIPEKFAPLMWGYPNKFISRMEAVNTRVILVAGDGSWSEGFDSVKDLERLPEKYNGMIWTNRIDLIAPIVKEDR